MGLLTYFTLLYLYAHVLVKNALSLIRKCWNCADWDTDWDTDIDECATDNGGCTEHSMCRNTPGSYYCECDDGYRVNGSQCVGQLPISAQCLDLNIFATGGDRYCFTAVSVCLSACLSV